MLLPASCLLEGFYGIIGFAKIEDCEAPPHL
jgi:hypothetical protein